MKKTNARMAKMFRLENILEIIMEIRKKDLFIYSMEKFSDFNFNNSNKSKTINFD